MATFCSTIRGKGHDRRHIRQLRIANRSSHGDIIRQDLGHFDNLLGNQTIKRPEDVQQQLFLQLRHRNIEHRSGDDLIHVVPLDPLLRPDLREPVRPGAPLRQVLRRGPERRAVHLPPVPVGLRASRAQQHFRAKCYWAAARAILTLSCSWRQAALKRFSLFRFAAEEVRWRPLVFQSKGVTSCKQHVRP